MKDETHVGRFYRLPVSLTEWLKSKAAQNDVTEAEWVRKLLGDAKHVDDMVKTQSAELSLRKRARVKGRKK